MKSDDLELTVEESINIFYKENNFGEDGGASKKYAWIKFGFFSIPIPNSKSRRENVYLHDVSHIVTGYDTSWEGESSVSAWEVASGGWKKLFIPWLLTLWAMGLGALFYPKSVIKSFKKGLTMNNALTRGLTQNEIYNYKVYEFKEFLSDQPNKNKSLLLWMILSIIVFMFPIILFVLVIYEIIIYL